MIKIQRVSFLFKVLFQILFIALPVLLILAWATSPDSLVFLGGILNMSFIPRAYTTAGTHGGAILHPLGNAERVFGFGLSALPTLIDLYIVYSLIKLFSLYEKGEIFSLNNVRRLRNIGYALFLGQILNPIYEGLMGIVLTWNNPPGQRFAAITLDQTNLGVLVMALLVILISWIMAEGCKLREEQQLTI